MDPDTDPGAERKNETPLKEASMTRKLPFVSCHMKVSAEEIQFHIKFMCMQSLVFVYHKFLLWKQQSWYKNDNCQFVVLICMKRFCIFMHFYLATLSIKTCFHETSNVYLENFRKTVSYIWKFIKNKCDVILDFFHNLSYVSNYFQTKTFAWKRDCAILPRL